MADLDGAIDQPLTKEQIADLLQIPPRSK